VPVLLAHDRGRILMPEIAGEDLYDADRPQLDAMVRTLVALQRAWLARTGELLALGLPDWRTEALTAAIADVVERTSDGLDEADRSALASFVDDLPRRFAAVASAGIPDTLVHGDFHPGNVRGDGTAITLLDWGDSGVGHPLLDQAAFLDRIPADAVGPIRALWHREWRTAVPNSDPDRAATLLAPVAAARQAVIYRKFLDGIEPSEHPYHASDPADWLRRTAALLREG
jgi:aminoglycoside phosphotransferase (APT) family kinase protein